VIYVIGAVLIGLGCLVIGELGQPLERLARRLRRLVLYRLLPPRRWPDLPAPAPGNAHGPRHAATRPRTRPSFFRRLVADRRRERAVPEELPRSGTATVTQRWHPYSDAPGFYANRAAAGAPPAGVLTGSQPVLDAETEAALLARREFIRAQLEVLGDEVTSQDMRDAISGLRALDAAPERRTPTEPMAVYGQVPVAAALEGERLAARVIA